MTSFDVDLFVIGGGSGGVRAARIAAGYGAKVMLAEEYRVGGTCVIRGCVPKKLMVYASRFAEEFREAAGFGWSVGETRFDWATLIRNKDREIARLESVYRTNLMKAGVEIIDSRAVIEDPHTVRILKFIGEAARVDHELLRHAAPDDAGAADPVLLRQHHLGARTGRDPGRAYAARPASDDEEINIE